MGQFNEQDGGVRTFIIKDSRQYATSNRSWTRVRHRLINKLLIGEVRTIDGQKV